MQFLNPLILGALLLAAIPVIIHLINKRRHRTIKWGAMMFLLQANRQSKGRRRLRHILILTCRVLALAALITAIARPIAGGWLGWAGNNSPETIILIFDRSPSMEVTDALGEQSKRANAITRLSKALREFGGGAKVVLIDSATREPLSLTNSTKLEELPQTGPSDAAADIPGLLTTAIEYLSASPGENAEIWIASDLQESNWQPQSGVWESLEKSFDTLPTDVPIRVLALTGDSASDTANLGVNVQRVERQGNAIIVDLQFNNQSSSEITIPVTFAIDGGSETQQSLRLSAGTTTIRKRIELASGNNSAGFGSVKLPADPNSRDNLAWFTYGDLAPLVTAVVAEPGTAADRLAIAAAPNAFNSRTAVKLTPSEWQRIDWENTSMVIWQAAIPQDEALESAMRSYVERGGQLAIFPPTKESATGEGGVRPSLLGVFFADNEPAPLDGQFSVTDWKKDTGSFANFDDGSSPALDLLFVIRRAPVSMEGGIPIALYSDDVPFATTRPIKAGAVTAFTSLPDDRWSDMLQHNVMFPALQRMIIAGASRVGGARLLDVGEPLPSVGDDWKLVSPGDASSINSLVSAGIYADRDGKFLAALNVPSAEASTERIDVAAVNALFADKPIRVFEERVTRESNLASPVWRFFAYAVLVFLFIEGLLSLPPKRGGDPDPELAAF